MIKATSHFTNLARCICQPGICIKSVRTYFVIPIAQLAFAYGEILLCIVPSLIFWVAYWLYLIPFSLIQQLGMSMSSPLVSGRAQDPLPPPRDRVNSNVTHVMGGAGGPWDEPEHEGETSVEEFVLVGEWSMHGPLAEVRGHNACMECWEMHRMLGNT